MYAPYVADALRLRGQCDMKLLKRQPTICSWHQRLHARGEQEILQLSIPEEHRNAVGSKETALFSFTGVLRDDATQEVMKHISTRASWSPSKQSRVDWIV